MDQTTTIFVILIAAVVVLVAVWIAMRSRRRQELRSHFGPEYHDSVTAYGSESKAARALEQRTKRVEKFPIHRLSDEETAHFSSEWKAVQAQFVDDPHAAIHHADALVCEAMKARGYPMTDFEQRAEDVSVDYPHVVRNYRLAHQIAEADRQRQVGTEDLRQAIVYYRDLFDELLEVEHVREGRR